MGIFRIAVSLRGTEPPYQTRQVTVFREFSGTDIDAIWHKLEIRSQEKWGRDLKAFDCVMVSKRSGEYKAFLAAEENRRSQPAFKATRAGRPDNGHIHPFAREERKRSGG